MDIKFTVFASGATIINNYLIYRAAETTSPGTIVANVVDPPPQTFPRPVFIAGVNPVPHIIQIYSSVDGLGLDLLLSEFMYDPSFTSVEVRPNIYLTTGGGGPYDPEEGDTFIGPIDGTIPGWESLADWPGWEVQIRGLGPLKPSEYSKNGANTGFTYPPGFYGENTQVITITFPPKIGSVTPIFNTLDVFTGYKRITASATVAPDWYNKYVDLVFTGDSGTITLQPLGSVPENRQLTLFNMNGNQEQITIKPASGEIIRYLDTDFDELYIGKGEELWLYKRTDPDTVPTPTAYWYVAKELTGMLRVGERFSTDTGVLEAALQKNAVALDGRALPKIKWPRIRWYAERLPVGMLIPIAERDADVAKRGRWAYDDDNTYVPDALGYHERIIPGTRGNDSGRGATTPANTYDGSYVIDHTHFTVVLGAWPVQPGFPTPPTAFNSIYLAFIKNDGSGKESYVLHGAPDANATAGKTSLQSGKRPGNPAQNENTVLSIGVCKLVRL